MAAAVGLVTSLKVPHLFGITQSFNGSHRMKAAFQAFRAATATEMVITNALSNKVNGGPLRRIQQQTLGTELWVMTVAIHTETATLSNLAEVSAASKIKKRIVEKWRFSDNPLSAIPTIRRKAYLKV